MPYGYRYVLREGDRRGRLEVNETEAALVREIFRAIVQEGLSLRSVAARLQAQGVSTPRGGKRWSASSVWSIVRDETYTGTHYYRKVDYSEAARAKQAAGDPPPKKPWRPREEWIAIQVPAIVDRAVWERAQAQLAANARFSPRHSTRSAPGAATTTWAQFPTGTATTAASTTTPPEWVRRRYRRCGGWGKSRP